MPAGTVLAKGSVQRIGEKQSLAVQQAGGSRIEIEARIADHDEALTTIRNMLIHKEKGAIGSLSEIAACGHRVVHGGEAFTGMRFCCHASAYAALSTNTATFTGLLRNRCPLKNVVDYLIPCGYNMI